MPGVRKRMGTDVFSAAIDRLSTLYREGHRLVVSFSAGKDSMAVLECAILAAEETGRLPVEVIMRDEEIMYPGTFEYAARTAARPEIDFHWIYACQPVINVFNRNQPYFWVFDPLLKPEQWVREPPDIAYRIEEKYIQAMTSLKRFPPPPGKDLIQVTGIRASESISRRYSVFSAKGYLTKKNNFGVRTARPIYDWGDGDVWKGVKDFGWDYNHAYDTMFRMGVPRRLLRIAPPSMTADSVESLGMAMRAWPRWFDRVAERLPGIRTAAKFGRRAVEPIRHLHETWEEVFQRECVDTAPEWIRERALKVRDSILRGHRRHSSQPLPDTKPCMSCVGNMGCWRALARFTYNGDPFSLKAGKILKVVEPEFFRPGAGTWGAGSPTFA